jgi:hypothetical protein
MINVATFNVEKFFEQFKKDVEPGQGYYVEEVLALLKVDNMHDCGAIIDLLSELKLIRYEVTESPFGLFSARTTFIIV